jgi:MscS family membrane protein
MMANTLIVEQNASLALEKVTQKSSELFQSMDRNIFYYIQSYINDIYNSSFLGRYLMFTIYGVPVGNIIIAVITFIFVFMLRRYFTKFIINILSKLAKRTKTKIDDILVNSITAPLRFFFIIVAFDLFFLLMFIDNQFTQLMLSTMLIIDIYWVFYSFIPAVSHILFKYSEKNPHLSRELSNFLVRLLKMLIFILGFISILYNLGVNVTAFIASLGLGGLAFALAAKDTVANLFGSIAIMMDGSIRVGDWIKVNDVEGIVEDIGMRTTKIRQFDKALVAVPNSQIANLNIINYSRRRVRRIKMVIGLTYDTTKSQIQNILKDISQMIAQHPNIDKNHEPVIRFQEFGASELAILIYTFTNTPKWREYLRIQEDINIKIMEIVEENGSSFAFPSQSLYLEKFPDETPLSFESKESRA